MSLAPLLPYIWAVLTTVIALGFWQYQLIAKRRYEVVETVLTAVDEATQALHYIRRAEADAKESANLNPEGLQPDTWQTAYARIQETEAAFRNLTSSTKLVAIHFGGGATSAIAELQGIYRQICDAHTSLYFRKPADKLYGGPEHQALVETWKSTLIATDRDDVVTRQIDWAEGHINAQFGKYLRPNALRLFIPFWGWNP